MEAEVSRPAARVGGTWLEAWPEKPLKSESGGSAWCWWGAEGEAAEGGSGTGGCPPQEGPAVGLSVPVEEEGVEGRCSASAGAAACSRVTGLGWTGGEAGAEGAVGEQPSFDSARCGAEAAAAAVTQGGKGTPPWT